MMPNTEHQSFWKIARHGWALSVTAGFAVLFIRYKALVPLVWQMLVKNGSAHTIGTILENMALWAAVIGAVAVFVFAVRTGYRRANQALEASEVYAGAGGGTPGGANIVLRVIARVSLLINVPILYWSAFTFVLLPQLAKLPNASLRVGTTAALAGAFIAMVIIVVLATHVGLVLTRFSYRSIVKAPAVATPVYEGATAQSQPLPYYAQPGAYAQRADRPYSQPQPMTTSSQLSAYGQQRGYYVPALPPEAPALPFGENAVAGQMLPYGSQGSDPYSASRQRRA